MPARMFSPGLRARANSTSSCWLRAAGKPLSRVIVMLAQPSAPVAVSVGIENCENGTAVTYTRAPWTGRSLHALTWKRTASCCVEPPITAGETSCRSSRRRAGELSCATLITPVPLGQPLLLGGVVVVVDGRGATTAVGTDVATAVPSALCAVTRTRSVLLRSGDESSYVFPVAPLMFEQLPPVRLQRRHWYVNVIGSVPVHLPGSAVSVEPMAGVPEIVGGDVFVGLTWAAAFPVSGPLSATAPNAASAASDAATATRTTIRLRCFIENFPLRYRPPDGGAPQGGVRRAVARTVSWTTSAGDYRLERLLIGLR